MKSYLTGCVFAAAGCQNMTHDNFINLIYRNFSTFDSSFDSNDTELNSCYVFELAVEAADRSTSCTYDDYIFH